MRACLKCGHEPCPICKEWCDVLLYEPPGTDDGGFVAEADRPVADEDWPVLCCGGACDYGDGAT